MQIFRSEGQPVTKYIHDDGSETSIKAVSSCDTVRDPNTGVLHLNPVERNKYSVFISSSTGCFMRCQFCHLTARNARYGKLNSLDLLANLPAAIQDSVQHDPSLRDRFVKLNWMGMGEDHMVSPNRTRHVTLGLLDWIQDNGFAAGLDGVDIASVVPAIDPEEWIGEFQTLDRDLEPYPLNPSNAVTVHRSNGFTAHYPNRSRVRLFYSLHSAVQDTRDRLIPKAMPLDAALPALTRFSEGNRYNLIFHHLLLNGVNDSDAEIDALLAFWDRNGLREHELRILRFNPADGSALRESDRFAAVIDRLAGEIPFLKVQISTGTDVKAACGQFIVSRPQEVRRAA